MGRLLAGRPHFASVDRSECPWLGLRDRRDLRGLLATLRAARKRRQVLERR